MREIRNFEGKYLKNEDPWAPVIPLIGARMPKNAFLKIIWQGISPDEGKNQAEKKSNLLQWVKIQVCPYLSVCVRDVMTSSITGKNSENITILHIQSHFIAKISKIEKESMINLSTTSNTLLTMALTKSPPHLLHLDGYKNIFTSTNLLSAYVVEVCDVTHI